MHILKLNTDSGPVYLSRSKPFDVMQLFKSYTSEFRKDVKITTGLFKVHIPLFVEYLIEFQDFSRIDHLVTAISVRNE